ncbi:sulfite reductase subunit alpha [Pseudoxanthomonas sp. 10H]|uniref:sulfite reductase subunit alpha n=1 Tax=Pseudoxanthomonas sp. 10H TaxID=3242729 RepID=UPI0035570BA6
MNARPPASGRAWAGNIALAALLVLAAALLLPLHGDAWWTAPPRPFRWWLAIAALLAYVGACAPFLWRGASTSVRAPTHPDAAEGTMLVVWASQTGFARLLAERSVEMLRSGAVSTALLPIDAVDAGMLARSRRALFIVSTTGEGDPPDHALAFLRRTMSEAPVLAGLEYALLALGDREYRDYCAFGRQLDGWLREHGARPLFDRVEVDNADQAALRHWQYEVGRVGGLADLPDWTPPAYEPWRLEARVMLNPGGPGAPVHDLALVPEHGPLPRWTAGDIAEIGPRHAPHHVHAWLDAAGLDPDARIVGPRGEEPLAVLLSRMQLPEPRRLRGLSAQALADRLDPLPHREYSIASTPDEGQVRLLVRRMSHPDGTPGLGSGWLCEHAVTGGTIDLRVRPNPGFHPPPMDRPLVLVGSGTGIAGLRAHLQARAAAGAHGAWLLFGERSPGHDRFYADDLRRWQAEGVLERVDLAFSRAPAEPAYVQHRLQAAADTLRGWIDRGASILVCGNAGAMAPAVDIALGDILGVARRDELRAAGRYRRDVY